VRVGGGEWPGREYPQLVFLWYEVLSPLNGFNRITLGPFPISGASVREEFDAFASATSFESYNAFPKEADEEAYGMLITVVVVKIVVKKESVASCRENKCAGMQKRINSREKCR
jgi:hypothetical protein